MEKRKNIKRRKDYLKHRKQRIFISTVILGGVIALICGITIMLCSDKDKSEKKVEQTQEQNKSVAIHTSDQQVDEKYISEDLSIDMPYGVIHFPQEFSDYTHIEVDETKEYYEVSFFCKYEENQIPLFSITFGKAGKDATVIGKLIDTDNKEKNVSIALSEVSLDTEWEKTNQELIYAMQEAVNYIMDNFESSYEYRPEK